jgi:hypothetical protein
VTISVKDSGGKTASKRFSFIVVEDDELAVMTDTLPEAQVGQHYSTRLRGCGGTKPYVWEIENLPDWLSLDSASGILSGTPPEPGIFDLMARVRDGEGALDSKLLRLSVYPHDGLLISTCVLPAPVLGRGYSAMLDASGGIAPYFFTLRRGFSLPPGLTLDGSGLISGTPERTGVYSFVADAADGNGFQGNAPFTVAVLDEKSLNPGADEFTVREDEEGKRIYLSFSLPADFNDAEITAVDALVSPDQYIAGTSVTPVENGERRAELTLYVSERVLKDGTGWAALTESLVFEGYTVRFRDGSGEEVRLEEALPFNEMKRETEDGGGNGGGGCDAGSGALLVPLAISPLLAVFRMKKRK